MGLASYHGSDSIWSFEELRASKICVSSFTSAAMADAFVVLERLAMMNLNYLGDPERYPKLRTRYTSSVK
jgi:hypothetical protein